MEGWEAPSGGTLGARWMGFHLVHHHYRLCQRNKSSGTRTFALHAHSYAQSWVGVEMQVGCCLWLGAGGAQQPGANADKVIGTMADRAGAERDRERPQPSGMEPGPVPQRDAELNYPGVSATTDRAGFISIATRRACGGGARNDAAEGRQASPAAKPETSGVQVPGLRRGLFNRTAISLRSRVSA